MTQTVKDQLRYKRERLKELREWRQEYSRMADYHNAQSICQDRLLSIAEEMRGITDEIMELLRRR